MHGASDLRSHPYHAFLHQVLMPSRYIGGEFGTDTRPPAAGAATMALVFPDVYEVGMSHLGSQILYGLCNSHADLRVERCFAPWPDLEAELRARGLPLVSLETYRPLREFDVVGVSLQHELSYTNLVTVLELGGLQILAADRGDGDPIVLGGGPCATRPEPVAPFFDAFFVGEAEAELPDLLRTIARMRREGMPRRDLLRALAKRPGLYCPALYDLVPDPVSGWLLPRPAEPGVPARIARRFIPDLDAFPVPTRTYVPWNRAVFDRASIEISRGCSEGCRFCEAGYTYRPLRDRATPGLLADTLAAVAICGHEEVSLGALSPADHPGLEPLVHAMSAALTPRDVTLTVSSLRAYGLSDQVLKDLKAVRATGLTLAPEAGSQRLRDVINKNVTEDDIRDAVARAFRAGWQRIKLYFMLGLPTETDDDVRGMVGLAREVLRVGRQLGKRAQVVASVGVFVPRPHTPFQWEGMVAPAVIEARQALLRDEARRAGVVVKYANPASSRMEGVFARGDRRLAGVIVRAHRKGCRYDNWGEHFRADLWAEAFAEEGLEPDDFLREIPVEAGLPWEIVDPLVRREFFVRERARAMAGIPLAPCEKPAPRAGVRPGHEAFLTASRVVCYNCGAGCDAHALAATRRATLVEANALECGGLMPPLLPADAPAPAPQTSDLGPQTSDPSAAWHLRYTRVGRAAWLSQKDVIKHIPRILRRAGLTLAMSGGFHPLPKMTFCPPLPVGYRSVGEWMDMHVIGLDGAPSIDALNAASVDGLVFLEALPIVAKRTAQRPFRYGFLSPLPAADLAPRVLPATVAPLGDPAVPDVLLQSPHSDRGGLAVLACELTWPPDHPPGRPHEVLTAATGVEFAPSDLVRLYDDPRAPL